MFICQYNIIILPLKLSHCGTFHYYLFTQLLFFLKLPGNNVNNNLTLNVTLWDLQTAQGRVALERIDINKIQ